MEKLQLAPSKVTFLQDDHKYFIGDKQLKGITGTLLHLAFPDKYKGISEAVLKKAADRGSLVHEQIEMLETVFDGSVDDYTGDPTPEIVNYNAIKHEHSLTHQAQEYLVSDNENFASAIDIVFTDKVGDIVLSDIKTTSQIYHDSVSLQLSIYAYFFERMNPTIKVSHLSCVWLRGAQYKYVELARVSDTKIKELISAYLNGDTDYRYEVEMPSEFHVLEQSYLDAARVIEHYSKIQDEAKNAMLKLMQENKAKTYRSQFGSYSYVAAGITKRFDAASFKKEHTDLYNSFIKESETKPQIRITLNKDKK